MLANASQSEIDDYDFNHLGYDPFRHPLTD
jgi:hypothetical protein